MMKKCSLLLGSIAVFIPIFTASAYAAGSVFVCNGVYQNRPCAKGVNAVQKSLPALSRYKARNYTVPEAIQERDIPLSSLNPAKLNPKSEEALSVENIPPLPQEEKASKPVEPADQNTEMEDFRISDPRINSELAKALGSE